MRVGISWLSSEEVYLPPDQQHSPGWGVCEPRHCQPLALSSKSAVYVHKTNTKKRHPYHGTSWYPRFFCELMSWMIFCARSRVGSRKNKGLLWELYFLQFSCSTSWGTFSSLISTLILDMKIELKVFGAPWTVTKKFLRFVAFMYGPQSIKIAETNSLFFRTSLKRFHANLAHFWVFFVGGRFHPPRGVFSTTHRWVGVVPLAVNQSYRGNFSRSQSWHPHPPDCPRWSQIWDFTFKKNTLAKKIQIFTVEFQRVVDQEVTPVTLALRLEWGTLNFFYTWALYWWNCQFFARCRCKSTEFRRECLLPKDPFT